MVLQRGFNVKKRHAVKRVLQSTAILFTLAAISVSAEIPDLLRSRSNPTAPPIWVSAENALLIIAGKITNVRQGFYAGKPTSLLTIEAPQFLKHLDGFSATTEVHISFPHAAISVGGYSFCTHEPSFPSRPESGDEVLMFAYEVQKSAELLILEPFAAGLIVERSSKEIEISDKLRDDLLLSSLHRINEVKSHLSEILSQGEVK